MHLYFDLDGTLFETKPVITATVRAFLSQTGRPYPGDEAVLSFVGRPMDVFMRGITGASSVSEEEVELFCAIEFDLVRKTGRLFDGTESALRALKEDGHALYVLSNGYIDYIEVVLQSTGARGLFDAIYTATYSPSKAHRLREVLPLGASAAFIGDTVDDLLAARQNSLPHIAARYGYGGADAFDAASYLAASPRDIPAIVRRLCARP